MSTLMMILQLFSAIIVIAGTHELGHMLAARMFGIRVEQFSIGFPPVLFRKQVGETLYSLGSIPLGGFVKLSGMMDESLDKAQLEKPAQDYEFRSKPAWQRLIVMLGGIIMNIITACVLFILLSYANGATYVGYDELNEHGIAAYELGEEIGLKTGDRVLEVNGQPYERFSDLIAGAVLLGDSSYYTVLRDGKRLRIDLPSDLVGRFSSSSAAQRFIAPRMTYKVVDVVPNSPARSANLEKGDVLLSLNGGSIKYFDELKTQLKAFEGQEVTLAYKRNNQTQQANITLFNKDVLGILQEPTLAFSKESYSFFESIYYGVGRVYTLASLNVQGISKIFTGKISAEQSLTGPIGIAKMFGKTFQWTRFWTLVALISIFVALFNLLPIPALDGGHVVFCLIEMATGKTPSQSVLRIAQITGMVLLGLLTLFILFNDIRKLL